jgi:hypothetical protein
MNWFTNPADAYKLPLAGANGFQTGGYDISPFTPMNMSMPGAPPVQAPGAPPLAGSGVTAPRTTTPTVPGTTTTTPPGAVGLDWNVGTGQLALSGIQTIGNIYNAWQAQDLAKKTFAFNRDIANTNLNNSIRSYNTALEDRAASREAYTSGRFDDSYVERNRARRG